MGITNIHDALEEPLCAICERVRDDLSRAGICEECLAEAQRLRDERRHESGNDAAGIDEYLDARRRHDQRIADHVDGYDRDDLGESPDY